MRKTRLTKRIVTYVLAATVVLSAGFMGTSFYSNAETQYITVESGARLRNTPSTDGGVVNKVPYGAAVEILNSQTDANGGTWYQVRYYVGDIYHEGWVRSDLMSASNPQAPVEEPDTTAEPDTTQQPDVQQPDTQEPGDTQEPTDTQEPADTQDPDVDFIVPDASVSGDGYYSNGDASFLVMGETLTISSTFADTQIPANFVKKEITYNNTTITGLQYSYGDVILVYLVDGTGTGAFYVLNAEQNLVHSFVTLSSGEHQLILLVPPANAQIAASYGKTIYATDEDTAVTAYQYNQILETTSATAVMAEYYYVYGVTQSGVPGWYLYDDVEKSFIRATTDLSIELAAMDTADQPQTTTEEESLEKMIIVVMGAICLICIIIAIVAAIRCARARKGVEHYEEEEPEEETEEELNFIQKRKQERKYRHFMEHFEEEGDEAWEHLLPEHERLPKQENIIAQVEETGWKEKEDYDVPVSEKEDYDLTDENSEKDEKEFDEIENILMAGLEASINEMDKAAGIAAEEPKEQPKEQPKEESKESLKLDQAETVAKKSKEDDWKDLEFLDI
ncbi:MAG: SH3 domain-containing protein [Eubacterium sp.]|nr:SH3 domain-containing protein [Eubacterium sp.]